MGAAIDSVARFVNVSRLLPKAAYDTQNIPVWKPAPPYQAGSATAFPCAASSPNTRAQRSATPNTIA